MNAVAYVLDGAVAAHNERLAEVRVDALALGIDADQRQLLPAAVDDILDAQIQLAAHDNRVRLTRELVEKVERDGVDLVVDVETFCARTGCSISYCYCGYRLQYSPGTATRSRELLEKDLLMYFR